MGIAPAEFPPPVDPAEDYVTEPVDPEEERIEVGVAIVGGGPAGLACAIKTMQLLVKALVSPDRFGCPGGKGWL